MNTTAKLSAPSAVSAISSNDIAKMTGKNHADVMRDIRRTFEDANIDQSKFASIFKDAYDRDQPCFLLPRFECDLVISGYSVPYRAAIIRRWHELEEAGAALVEHTPPPSVLSPDEVDPRLRSLLWLTQELVKMGSKPEKAIIAAGKSLPRPPAVPGSRWAAIAPAPADGLAEAAAALLDAVASKFPEGWTGNITSLAAFAPPSRHTLQRILPFVAKQAPDRVQKICRRINRRTCRQWSFITPATNSKEAVAS